MSGVQRLGFQETVEEVKAGELLFACLLGNRVEQLGDPLQFSRSRCA
jgi:hypothetical protein